MITWLGTSVEHCLYYGKGWLVLFSDLGDLWTFIAYASLPIAISVVLARRHMAWVKFKLAFLFAAFILLCGVGHLLDIISLHWGADLPWLQYVCTAETLLTGAVSLATAWYAFGLIRTICALPDPVETELVRRTLANHREAEAWKTFDQAIWGKP